MQSALMKRSPCIVIESKDKKNYLFCWKRFETTKILTPYTMITEQSHTTGLKPECEDEFI